MSPTASELCSRMCKERIRGRLPGRDLVRIYERIIDVMRNIQKEEIVPRVEAAEAETEFDSDVND